MYGKRCSSFACLAGCLLFSAVTSVGSRAQAQGLMNPLTQAPPLSGTGASGTELQRYQRLSRAHRGLEIATAATLLLTGTLGLVPLINQPTLLSDGRCDAGNPVLGDYGCTGFNLLHGFSGVAAIALYTAERSVWLSLPKDLEQRRLGPRYTPYKVLGYVHLASMILQPVLGLVGAYPPVFGLSPDPHTGFARTLKTLHVFNGFLLGSTYLATTILNF